MGLFGRKAPQPEPVIDFRDAEAAAPVILWGMPAPCPDCGKPGYLDHINPFERVMYQHCPSCFAKWAIAEADIIAAGSS